MINTKPNGDESGTFNITNDFRQITLFKNLDLTDSSSPGGRLGSTSVKVNRSLTTTATLGSLSPTFVVDEIVTGGTSGVTAIVDEVDSSGGKIIRFHQNEKTRNGNFTNSETITGGTSGASATVDSGTLFSAVDIYSGDLLYLENRARIVRSASQTEDIKVIITV